MKLPPKAAAAALATGLLLTACSSADPGGANEKIQLTMSVWGSKEDAATYTARLALAQKKFPNITVKLEHTPGSGDYDQKIQTALAGRKGPDIMQFAENVHVFSSKNQLAPLDDYLAKAKVDLAQRFGDRVSAAYQREGKTYAMPDRSGAMVLYYNKKAFDEAGLKYPDASWTWTDFRAAAQKLTVREGDKVTRYGFAAGDWWPWWMTFMKQNGGEIIDASGKPVVNSPANVEALTFYNDLVYVDKVAPSPTDYANLGKDIGPDPLFAQGKAAMQLTGFWNIGALKAVPDIQWDIAPIWQGKQKATVAFGSGLSINNNSEHKDAAFQIIDYLTGEEGQRPIVENNQDAPANLALLDSDAFMKSSKANMKAFKESTAMIYTPPTGAHWNEMQKVFTDALGPFFQNKADAQSTLDRVQKDLQTLLGTG
ncbi:ABC transporter substrate-binding protein [Nonomuraea sp. NPDC049152]|uniref:ABC transporter substrate-binding protein n=1 Tax=Nonomuraea sp. NPDC049152 TaxID=3154350 RepID=UPI0033DD170E